MKLDDFNLLDVGHSIQLAGTIYSDGDRVYLIPLPDALTEDQREELSYPEKSSAELGFQSRVVVLDMDRDDWQRFIRQTDLLETEILNEAGDNGKLVKAIVRKSQRQISQRVSWAVFKRDGYTCRYCGRDDVPLTVDHLVLWEERGPSTEENLVAACKKCNKTRGSMQYVDWLKSPYYTKSRKGLMYDVQFANNALAGTLVSIERVVHKSKKR